MSKNAVGAAPTKGIGLMGTTRWGVISTARIGTEKVIPGIQAAPNCEVTAIAGREQRKALEVADRLGIPTAHGSYQDLLDDESVDVVYIPLPNHLHAEWTIRAAEAGKHVLCEKPLALSSADAQGMVDACAAAGVLFMEAFMYRLHPTWQQAVAMVNEGRIGELLTVQSWFSYFNDDPTNIRNIAAYGGGALMDIGCYSINLSRLLFGAEPDSVSATVDRDPASGVDTTTTAILGFGDRAASFTCSTRCEPDQRVHIYGSEGRISIEIPFNIPPDRPTRLSVTAGGNPPTDPATEVITVDAADQYSIEAEQFAEAVLGERDLPIPAADGVANMVVIEKVLAAAS